MHVKEGSSVKNFLEGSVNFQTADVVMLYSIIFSALAIICLVQYHMAKQQYRHRKAMMQRSHHRNAS